MIDGEHIKIGWLNINLKKRKIRYKNKEIHLRNKEFSLLAYLAKKRNKVITRAEILEEVWDRNIFCNTNTVDVHVSSLRRKLSRFSKKQLITTIHCLGYMIEIDNKKSF